MQEAKDKISALRRQSGVGKTVTTENKNKLPIKNKYQGESFYYQRKQEQRTKNLQNESNNALEGLQKHDKKNRQRSPLRSGTRPAIIENARTGKTPENKKVMHQIINHSEVDRTK